MRHSNLIRVLLLFTLVGTLSSDYALKANAQVINDLSSNTIKQRQTRQSHQDVLQKIDILQQKAENFRQTVDRINIQLQEQLNSPQTSQKVDFKPILANWEQLNRIWHELTKNLEQNPEFSHLLQKDRVFYNIDQSLTFQEKIISNLAKVLNKSSSPTIIAFQEQIFTKKELNNHDHPHGIFEARTQHKFALISTNKARELELQIYQLENILFNYLLYKKQPNNPNYRIIQATTKIYPDTEEFVDNSDKKTRFFNFNTLIVLTLLSSCGMFIALKTYKKNSSSLEDHDLHEDAETEKTHNNVADYNVVDYLKNVQKVESQARELLSSTNHIIENQQINIGKDEDYQLTEYFADISEKRSQPNLDFPDFQRTESLPKTTQQAIPAPLPMITSLATEEDVIILYRNNRQSLLQKAIRVDVTQESIQRLIIFLLVLDITTEHLIILI